MTDQLFIENIDEIADAILASNSRRIGIDGMQNVGKTYLATVLSEKLKLQCFHLDDCIFAKNGVFFKSIDTRLLDHLIDGLNDYIVDGVCLRQVSEASSKCGIDFHIYVRTLGAVSQIWYDKFICFPENCEEEAQGQNDAKGSILTEELRQYHNQFKPYQRADLIFTRFV